MSANYWDITPGEMLQPCEACIAHSKVPMMMAFRAELRDILKWTDHFVAAHKDYTLADMRAFLRESEDAYETDEDGFIIQGGGGC